VTIGIRSLLLVVAVVLFVVAALSDTNQGDLLAWGLAAFAGAFLVGDLGVDRPLGGSRRR
jgi:hypothetical protein